VKTAKLMIDLKYIKNNELMFFALKPIRAKLRVLVGEIQHWATLALPLNFLGGADS
jgi:ABC-type uncharacterized transport system permease subunit